MMERINPRGAAPCPAGAGPRLGGSAVNRCAALGLAGLLSLLGLAEPLTAQAADARDLPTRQSQYHEHHLIAADGKTVSNYRLATLLLKPEAIEEAKQTSLDVSRSAQSLQILEAYTLKANGKRVSVPKSSWQVRQDTGKDGQSPLYSDYSNTSLVFPDAAVGDTLVLAYKISTKEPLFPGKVSMQNSFSRQYAFDDVRVVVDAPATMALKTQAIDMQESVRTEGGRKIISWTYQNKTPQAQTRQNWSVFDPDSMPGYRFSSFNNWQEIAASYVERAQAKAQPNEQIRALAERLSADKPTVREQVQALHEWVATQIDYGGNCVGIGAVVPRDLALVLKLKMGDCKDHATLLQALLTAKGIESHQALVNAGNVYRHGSVPVAAMVNHVINYIPALALFVDSTDRITPLGRLPVQLYGKPVLAASDKVPSHTQADPGGNVQTMSTQLQIAADGSVEGEVKVHLGGHFALAARGNLRKMGADQRAQFVRNVFRAAQLEAEGDFEMDDPARLSDQFNYLARFKVKKAVPYPGTGALQINPWFYSIAPISHFAGMAVMPLEEFETVCSSAESSEDYLITLPEGMQVLALPQGTAFSSPLLAYESSYVQEGRLLKVKRQLQDRTVPTICAPQVQKDYKQAAGGVLQDVKQQLLYK